MARLFAPAVEVKGLRVPIEEMAEALRVEVAYRARTWVVKDPTTEQCPVMDLVAWPMDAEAFTDWGAALMEHLHDICKNREASEGNEFLDRPPYPAQQITAALYVSDDQGATWQEVRLLGWRHRHER